MRDISATMAKILAENVNQLRVTRGETQAEFADAVGVTQATVSRWEEGRSIKPEHLFVLARMAGVSPEDFNSRLLGNSHTTTEVAVQAIGGTVLLPVMLPNEAELTAMFEGFLEILGDERDRRTIARRLAQLLPSGLVRYIARWLNTQPQEG